MTENKLTESRWFYHVLALFTSLVWGTTFISTKILLSNGLSPAEILLFRFFIAYCTIWIFAPKKLLANNIKDELTFVAAGIAGGSLYFVTENMALEYTLASNVSIIICTAPLFTALLVRLFHKSEKLKPTLLTGSFIALLGVSLVVFNGSFMLKISPMGDILTIMAALSWAFYSIIIKSLNNKKYNVLLVTRKVFFYGLVTLLPFFLFRPMNFEWSVFSNPVILFNIIFLGFLASMLCFFLWNVVVKHIGAVSASNYIYLGPAITSVSAYIFLDEKITPIAVLGCVFILIGVYVAEKGFNMQFLYKGFSKIVKR